VPSNANTKGTITVTFTIINTDLASRVRCMWAVNTSTSKLNAAAPQPLALELQPQANHYTECQCFRRAAAAAAPSLVLHCQLECQWQHWLVLA
jgi:hypothetical protein